MLSRRDFMKAHLIAGAATVSSLASGGEPTPKRTYRACIIGNTGRGNYGHDIDTAFTGIPGVTVAAVADPDRAGREAAAARSGAARTYADWEEMLAKEKPDLLGIGPRWVEGRLEMVRAAAACGAHIYTEKPLAASLEEADAIVAAAEKGGIKLTAAHQAVVAPVIVHLEKLVGEGRIGTLLEMRTRGKEDHRSGGEDMMVLGTHCMYLMRLFGGQPLWCSARVCQDGREVTAADRRKATEPLGLVAGDTIDASFAFPGGLSGHFASHRAPQGEGGRFTIALHGSKGIALVHIDPDPKVFWLPDRLWSPGLTGARWEPLPGAPSNEYGDLRGTRAANRRLVEDLIRAVETGGEPVAGAREARATLEMILAVYAAHLRGGRVSLPLEDRKHPLA